ncbi:DMT family transporter [Kiloniella laminariae]|uniref:DMT family transporter n=1 Tax=Kiloniella laminariae TaxID=454162 RepID=UPI0003713C4B|nr:DMT family transporter [Kiloniella laminariae]
MTDKNHLQETSLLDTTGKGILLAILAMAFFSSGDAVVKHVSQNYSLPQLLWVRYMILSFLVVGMAVKRGGLGDVIRISRSKNLPLQLFRSAFLVGEAFLFTLSFKLLPIADVHAIVAVAPICVTALSAFWLKEAVGLRRWMAVLVGFSGIMVILRPGFDAFDPLLFLPLVAAAAFAIYQILLRISSRYDDGQISQFYTGIVPLFITSFMVPFFWVQPDLNGWIALIGGGIFISLGHLFLIFAFQYATPSAIQPFNYTLLVWATLFGWLFYDDLPDSWTIAGALIVVASGLYTIYRERIRRA